MFSDDILEKIFCDDRTQKVPIIFQTIMIKVIEDVLHEQKGSEDATIN